MKLAIIKFIFTIIICIPTLIWSTSIDIVKSTAHDAAKFPNLVDELRLACENEQNFLHFNAVIPNINQDFISGPLLETITCLNLMDNHIENIERGAFNKFQNLTHLFLSNNRFKTSHSFNFGGHYKLQVLIINNALRYSDRVRINIFDYPNLEILSLRKNSFNDFYFSQEESSYTMVSTVTQKIPFSKLQILDLSENYLTQTDFFKLLPNSLLYFLDLHTNKLEYLNLGKIGNKLFALNLDNNQFKYIINIYNFYRPSIVAMADLTDLQYFSISTNLIENIDENSFQNNPKLIYLNLSANSITYLYPRTFENLQYLKTLDLSSNKLGNVPQISNEIEINVLYINNNKITKLMSNIFMQMTKLTKLLLGENQIDEINVNAFANLSVLEQLDLSRNRLSSLPEGWTESLASLKYLDLSENKFTSLESLSLTNALSLMKVYLMRNSLEDLNVRYFESLPQNLTIDLKNKSSFTN